VSKSGEKMKIQLSWLNCFWLLLPLLVWNIALAPKITLEQVISDAYSPAWLLMAENITRILVFAFPLLLPMQVKDNLSKTGLIFYLAGTLVYFASWLPLILAPDSAWSHSATGLLAPRITPYLIFFGISLIGHSLSYAVISISFIVLHTWHGIQNLTI
jgi:hypothetical protein